ncbi:hypothetical protein GCM10027594_15890 [Hymenobacter agri]
MGSQVPTKDASGQPIKKVYTYVEQMPQLPGGGGSMAIVSAIQSRVRYPVEALKQHITGRVFVSFTVAEDGQVRDARVVKGIGGGCDEAVLTAVQQLPQFIPGRQAGRPVPVLFTVPVTFQIAEPATAAANDTIERIYTLVQQMPELPGGGGSAAIIKAVQRALVQPATALASRQVEKVFVSFVVGPSGVVRDSKIVKGVNAEYDAAALAAVQHLPRFVGGKMLGRPVSVSFTVPVEFGRSVRAR